MALRIASGKPKGCRAVGIVIHDDAVFLMRRMRDGQEYYIFPGGGVEVGETEEGAVVRELQEETSLTISVERLLSRKRETHSQRQVRSQ